MIGTAAIATQSIGTGGSLIVFPRTLTQDDIAAIVTALLAHPLLLTVPKFMALK